MATPIEVIDAHGLPTHCFPGYIRFNTGMRLWHGGDAPRLLMGTAKKPFSGSQQLLICNWIAVSMLSTFSSTADDSF